jgi:hypothetical protein
MSSIYRRNDGLYVAQFVDENGKQKYLYVTLWRTPLYHPSRCIPHR